MVPLFVLFEGMLALNSIEQPVPVSSLVRDSGELASFDLPFEAKG